MNDIAKTNIKEKLEKAIESEHLLNQDVAEIFGFHPSYISWFKNPKYWNSIGVTFWERVLAWVNSGQSLKEYAEKHGKVQPVKKTEVPEPMIKVKPEALEKRKKELAERNEVPPRISKGALIDLLLEEKELLKSKIEAIDLLLKHYIS
jgi:hypothetical protein